MISIKNYIRPDTLEEAYALNQKPNNRVIGGMLFLKLGHGSIDTAIDLSGLGLSGIEETEDSFEIGAMTTLRELERHPGLDKYSDGAVRDALSDIVGVQFRNLATVGGSLYGRYGFSDVLTLFMSMDADVELYQGGRVPLSEYACRKYDRDLILKLIVRKTPGHFVYQALRLERTDIALLNIAVSYIGGEFRTVIGARPMKAMRIPDSEGFLSENLTDDSIRAFSAFAENHVPTGSNVRGSASYRSHLVGVLTRRNLEILRGLL